MTPSGKGFRKNRGSNNEKKNDRDSYAWDTLIELLSDLNAKLISGSGPTLTELELALRTVARESRFSRRILGKALRDFIAQTDKIRSRALFSPNGVIYVLVWFHPDEEPKYRASELYCRCMVARRKVGRGDKVVGIGLSPHVEGMGSASDLILIHLPDWSEADDAKVEKMQRELGYFAQGEVQHFHTDEYPAVDSGRRTGQS